ncbi:hypothetical protein AMECASPLE_023885 [Ameca splendens]|uniref:Uncharacterized protein n=1 Tax=Ameca splendens TaxID=208324 RepID=A0ABV0ZF24_9TELE
MDLPGAQNSCKPKGREGPQANTPPSSCIKCSLCLFCIWNCTRALDFQALILHAMLWRVLETTPCCSNHDPPFLSYLQPYSSEITSWKYQTIAHRHVHPLTRVLQQAIIHHQHASPDPSGRSSLVSVSFCLITYKL